MQEKINEANFFEKSPIKEVYLLLGINNKTDRENYVYLSNAYTDEDQKLFKTGLSDYNNPGLITNKIKEMLEKVDEVSLSEDEKEWRNEILWFWYHHAISDAIYNYHDLEKAKFFAEEALKYQARDEDHPNKITKLFYLLLHDKLAEAEELFKDIEPDEQEAATIQIRNYKNGWWKKD